MGEKPLATVQVGTRKFRLYDDRIEWKNGPFGSKVSVPLEQAVVAQQMMGGGMGVVTFRRQTMMLTISGPGGVSVAETIKSRLQMKSVAKFAAAAEAQKAAVGR